MKVNVIKFILSFWILASSSFAFETIAISFNHDEQDIDVRIYEAKGDDLLIVMPSTHGLTSGLQNLVKDINSKNTEVWIADPYSSFFLPTVESSLKKIPINAYVSIIQKAIQTKKNIYLLSNDKANSVLLKSAYKWQSNSTESLKGVILISPNLYKVTPSAGNDGEFLGIVSATNLPITLFIPEKSTLALRVKSITSRFNSGGSDVDVKILDDVRDRFFFRDDALNSEKNLSKIFAFNIVQSMKHMKKFSKKREVKNIIAKTKKVQKKTTRMLKKYKGKLKVSDFTLSDIKNNIHQLDKYKGKVVLLNFWASWCPPCVHEMPSMSKLYDDLSSKPFTILAVNLGETKKDMKPFLDKYQVSFPILLDPKRDLAKSWKVFAFPTSYILDKKGKIRYSIAGGFDWNTKEVKDILEKLINE